MEAPIKLAANGDGTYREVGHEVNDVDPHVTWVKTEYTEPREATDECTVCEKPIEDWQLWLCLDGGEAAHLSCVEVQR